VSPWGEWSKCDNDCGKGKMTRSRVNYTVTDYTLQQEACCYTTCLAGACKPTTCHNPGQVCEAGMCICPDCTGLGEEPVCGLVGNVIKTYENECTMQRQACELTKSFTLLEPRACEDKPPTCASVRNFAKLTDEDGCVSTGSEDIGFCYGGCGENPGLCCRPDTSYNNTPKETVNLIYL